MTERIFCKRKNRWIELPSDDGKVCVGKFLTDPVNVRYFSRRNLNQRWLGLHGDTSDPNDAALRKLKDPAIKTPYDYGGKLDEPYNY